jgi:cytidylate kinase
MSKRIVVAIDGPAGSGKSTVAKRVAAKLGCTYIDTGAMYRAVALLAERAGVDLSSESRLEAIAREAKIELPAGGTRVMLNGEDVTEAIRTPRISEAASKISAVPAVRRVLVEKQRAMASETSVVMEGRDIGTVVFPNADIKIFLDASPEIRKQRRLLEQAAKGDPVSPEEIAREIEERDLRDRTRADSPLLQAPDAMYIDTSDLSLDEVEERILKLIRDRTSNGKETLR